MISMGAGWPFDCNLHAAQFKSNGGNMGKNSICLIVFFLVVSGVASAQSAAPRTIVLGINGYDDRLQFNVPSVWQGQFDYSSDGDLLQNAELDSIQQKFDDSVAYFLPAVLGPVKEAQLGEALVNIALDNESADEANYNQGPKTLAKLFYDFESVFVPDSKAQFFRRLQAKLRSVKEKISKVFKRRRPSNLPAPPSGLPHAPQPLRVSIVEGTITPEQCQILERPQLLLETVEIGGVKIGVSGTKQVSRNANGKVTTICITDFHPAR